MEKANVNHAWHCVQGGFPCQYECCQSACRFNILQSTLLVAQCYFLAPSFFYGLQIIYIIYIFVFQCWNEHKIKYSYSNNTQNLGFAEK